MTISVWINEHREKSSMKELACLKRSEPKLSFCKCLVFQSDLDTHFNKFGNTIDQDKIETNVSLKKLFLEKRVNNFYVTVPYDSKEITTFMIESRKKIITIDITKDSSEKISDVVMCMKLIAINTELYLILCTEEGHLSLYNMKLKHKDCHLNLKSEIKANKKRVQLNLESENETLNNDLDVNLVDTPMAIDFDVHTMRGVVGTNSSNLYCFKLYLANSNSCDNTTISPSNTVSDSTSLKDASHAMEIKSSASMKIKIVLELKHSGVSCISIKPDGKLFVLSFWDGNGIYIYNWSNMKCISYIDYVYKTIHDLNFYSNSMLAIACDGGKVSLWSFSN